MSLSDIFSIPFLICISICVLLIGCSSIYFYQKISQQDHKIASMVGLLSTMAEETTQIHEFQNNLKMGPVAAAAKEILIHVSDDDDDDDDDNDSSSDDSESSDDDTSSEISHTTAGSINNKKIYINLTSPDMIVSSKKEDIVCEELVCDELDCDELDCDELDCDELNCDELDCNEESSDEEDLEEAVFVPIVFSTEVVDLEHDLEHDLELDIHELHMEPVIVEATIDFSTLKTINISNIEDSADNEADYKKMSISKLRKIMRDKGVPDYDKLRKPDILKMLEPI